MSRDTVRIEGCVLDEAPGYSARMLLLLIRHALTPQVGVTLSGWTPGIHLSDEGRAQAQRLAERLAPLPLDVIYSSPLERARETAEPVARAKGIDVVIREDLGEVRYGELQGQSLKALAETPLWTALRARASSVRFPGGEALRDTQARAVAAIEQLREDHAGKTVAVFSHGDWIRLAMAHFTGVHIDLYRRLSIDPVSVSALAFYGDTGVQVKRLNDTGELVSLVPPETERAR